MTTNSASITAVKGTAIPVPGNDIDTDRIIPARYLRSVTFEGLGAEVFKDERFNDDGSMKEHPFNDDKYTGATLLIVGRNFGCGSSREHAPQAIMRSGIKAIIGESFGEIFAGNCTSIGVPVCTTDEQTIEKLQKLVQDDPRINFDLNIETQTISFGEKSINLEMNPAAKTALLAGTWNTLDELLQNEAAIDEVHRRLPSFV
ncbi:MAG: 3-isopropylmalate dehydratase small subunit [Desulfobulbaceae bacterium]|nr:MAG: 3-isopropylmalate dehydratase small subunit [Desulfobulbaceae bacterium]